MTAYSDIHEYLKSMGIEFIDRFAPYLTCSIGCHLINMENHKRGFCIEQGQISNMRIHIFFIAPTGYFKSLLIRSYLHGPYSVLDGCGIESGFEGLMTEAGFVGSIKQIGEEVKINEGAASAYKEGIIGIEEFSALTSAMKQEHSLNLDNAMLTALDNGFVIKRLSAGVLRYQTHCTVLCGSQPARFDLTSGLGRRFIYMWFIPTEADRMKIRMARRMSKGLMPDAKIKQRFVNEMLRLKLDLKNVKEIKYEADMYKLLDRINAPHYEEPLYERLALGYTLMTRGASEVITVRVDEELNRLITQAAGWRISIKKGADVSQVIDVVRGMNNASEKNVKERLLEFGFSYETINKIMIKLVDSKMIRYHIEEAGGVRRRIIVINDDEI